MKNNRKIIFVGRFCPFHNAHESVINFYRGKPVVIVIGSAQAGEGKSFDSKTMFSASERKEMINLALDKTKIDYSFVFLPDFGDDKKWAEALLRVCGIEAGQMLVSSLNEWTLRCCQSFGIETAMHPEFFDDGALISATEIRRRIVAGEPWEHLVNQKVAAYLKTKILFDGLTGVERIKKFSCN